MSRQRDKDIRRTRTRRNKLKSLRIRLSKAKNDEERNKIIKKMEKIHPFYFLQAQAAQQTTGT